MTNPHDKAIEAAVKSAKEMMIHMGWLEPGHQGPSEVIYRVVESAIAAYERAMWRPIEEAPHNRTVILGWRDWRDGKWCMEVGAAAWGERVGDYSNRSQHGSATHFRPLPPVPEGE